MPDSNLPIDPDTILPMPVENFANIAIDAALWLVQESQEAIANKTTFDPDPKNCFKMFGRLPAVRVLRDLTEDHRRRCSEAMPTRPTASGLKGGES
jgi:hypothetical protein